MRVASSLVCWTRVEFILRLTGSCKVAPTELHGAVTGVKGSLDELQCVLTLIGANQILWRRSRKHIMSGQAFFLGLDAAWLNEGRCPGGRPSVS